MLKLLRQIIGRRAALEIEERPRAQQQHDGHAGRGGPPKGAAPQRPVIQGRPGGELLTVIRQGGETQGDSPLDGIGPGSAVVASWDERYNRLVRDDP